MDGVATDGVGGGSLVLHSDTIAAVEGDEVGLAGRGAADDVVGGVGGRTAEDPHPMLSVGDGGGARSIRADVVPQDGVAAGARDVDAVGLVARDDVALGIRSAADNVVLGFATYVQAGVVGHGGVPSGVGADVVPLDGILVTRDFYAIAIAVRDNVPPHDVAITREIDAVPSAPGDDVALARTAAADDVALRPGLYVDT